ncbi:MAG: purine-binding chemotaxis protein CheW [Oligoflexia bacterium]|nr:purine-binding chemotaxis protein CheW [Oligoflexia bacterium]MBF0366637.1 purine-binding chemotaxis protein CheW [Oligoflexia bacterium]
MSDIENGGVDNEWKYLIYRLGGELYGSPLLSIKEVLKVSKIKPVPYTVPHYRGIISLRGNIIGVVDLRIKFGLDPQEGRYGSSVLIVENEQIIIGALVDDVDSVVSLSRDNVDLNPAIETKIDPRFFIGVAKLNDDLVNLIDIAGTLSNEDLKLLSRTRGVL